MEDDQTISKGKMRGSISWSRYAIGMVFMAGLFLGTFRVIDYLRNSEQPVKEVNPREGKFALSDLPEGAPDAEAQKLPEPVNSHRLPNAEPIVLKNGIISGAQTASAEKPERTPDQIRLTENSARDFAFLLDPEVRDPNSEENRRTEAQLVRKVITRSRTTQEAEPATTN